MSDRIQHIFKFMDFDKLTDWETKFMESIESHYKARHTLKDISTYGNCIYKTGIRKWYNPLCYIFGDVYKKRINPKNIYNT